MSFDDCRFFGNRTLSDEGANYGGGGLLLYSQTAAGWCSVSNSVFGSNETGGRGGAFSHEWNAYCQAAIENCVFTNNVSYRQGGAICLREDSSHKHTDKVATIRNCLVVGNRTTGPSEAAATAGGILLVTYNDVEVANCTVVSNVASYVHNTNSGGGVSVVSGTFLSGVWDASGSWFLVEPDGLGGAVETNGIWTTRRSMGFRASRLWGR